MSRHSCSSEVNAGHGRMQCLPNCALAELNPTDPAMAEADREPFRVEIQANESRGINTFPDSQLHESLFFPKAARNPFQ
jgi:hypothetical protein